MELSSQSAGGANCQNDSGSDNRPRGGLLQRGEKEQKLSRENSVGRSWGYKIPVKIDVTFYRLHVIYFLLISILGTSILYMEHRSDTGEKHFSAVNSFFNVVSFATGTGLNSVRMADFSMFDRILFLALMTLGSPVFTSLLPLFVRRFYFRKHYRKHVNQCGEKITSQSQEGQSLDSRKSKSPGANPGQDEVNPMAKTNSDRATSAAAETPHVKNKSLFFQGSQGYSKDYEGNQSGHGQILPGRETGPGFSLLKIPLKMDIFGVFKKPLSNTDTLDLSSEGQPVLLRRGTIFAGRILGPRKPLLGVPLESPFNIMMTMEHRSLVVLSWLVPIYMVVSQLSCFLLSLLTLYSTRSALKILNEMSMKASFFSFFTVIAAFTNSGVPVSDDNLIPFQSQYLFLLLYTLSSLLGNLLYPPCIRLVISILHNFANMSTKPVYSYLLRHPRRCFTHLFPHKQSIWLCLTVIGFTAFQLIFFCALDWNSDALAGLNATSKVVDGIFQSVSVRNAGGQVVNVSELSSATLVLYLFMMFIAAYPVVLLRQNSTEYEHAEIGIYNKGWEQSLTDNSIAFQSRKLLAKDSTYLCIILFLICLVENKNIDSDPLNYSIFNIIFEVVSAYGGVGMSLGYSCNLRLERNGEQLGPCTDVPYSFAGKWTPAGRIILTIAMFIGRHRGLPDDVDSAIKVPNFNEIQFCGNVSPPSGSGFKSFALSPRASAAPGPSENNLVDQTFQGGRHQSQLDSEKQQVSQ